MNPIPLARLARAQRPRLRSVRLRPTPQAPGLESELRRILMSVVDDWGRFLREVVVPAYDPPPAPLISGDSDMAQLFRILRLRGLEIDSTIVYQTERLGRWVTRVGEWHGRKMSSAVLSAIGVDVAPFMMLSDIQDVLAEAIEQNTQLITGISRETQHRVAMVIAESFALRRNKRDLTRLIAQAMGVSQRRARLIAGDQTSKIASRLDQLRHQQLGFSSYVWRTRGDDRVRPAHRRRDGRVFRWDSPPPDGHPGWPVNCRCVAEAYMEFGSLFDGVQHDGRHAAAHSPHAGDCRHCGGGGDQPSARGW